MNLGVAFQIQDDLFEIFGDEKIMGKSLGSDITSNKKTALAILAKNEDEKKWEKQRAVIKAMDLVGLRAEYARRADAATSSRVSKDQVTLRPRVAVVGVGHLGKHHMRLLSALDCDLVGVADPSDDARAFAPTASFFRGV